MLLGTSVGRTTPSDFDRYQIVTPHNAFKILHVVEFENEWKFELPDRFVNLCETWGKKPRGHCLLWHRNIPDWVLKSPDLEETLKGFVQTMVKRYPQVYAWDVINEPVADNGDFRDSIITPYIEKAFHWAHEANPEAKLFLNDYRPMLVDKWTSILDWCQKARDKGVPIHGIGVQHHHRLRKVLVEGVFGWKQSRDVAKKIIAAGFECEFTESSVVSENLPIPNAEQLTLNFYKSLENIARSEGVSSFTYWRGHLE
jgi:endo-1,4-beta-xylanase